MTPRRELWLSVTTGLVGGLVALVASRATWATVQDSVGTLTTSGVSGAVRGTSIASGSEALAIVGLLAALAVAATKRWGRLIVGLIALAAGVGLIASVIGALDGGIAGHAIDHFRTTCGPPNSQGFSDCHTVSAHSAVTTTPAWAGVSLLGGALIAVAGLAIAVRGRSWAAWAAADQAATASLAPEPEEPVDVTDKVVWDALDRGDDPTA